ncbi:unnamed protein product [Clonostachys rhizophaga]|uniref:Choline monooxygenase, chloroplastic n=1 Tax=Clonostachys rhizophaga TaxID=160324 RepID=A0A9N9VC55_9HYPO|nr:unnamed protein product [Clonostachys rhizophaga]
MHITIAPYIFPNLIVALALGSFALAIKLALAKLPKSLFPKPSPQKATVRALPSSWYRSAEVYELERRAIFSKKWILISHKLRFVENGTWIRFEEAGFQFFLVKDHRGRINGFHNVCRHRAFPIVTEEKGKSLVLACKYHGWSYGLSGQLAKAPGYLDMEGFDKTKNGLFPIHVHVDAHGFIWVNLDASKNPEPFGKEFDNIDKLERHKAFNFDDYHFDHTWEMSGDYNWKTLADNYNECYHCKTTHPDALGLSDLDKYSVEVKGGHIEHLPDTTNTEVKDVYNLVSNYYFPNACMTVTPHFFYMMRCVPTSYTHCSMEYEVYRHKNASDEDFKTIDEMFKRILNEDKWLCNNAQKNLNAGVFVNGEMHPRMEQGPLYFQSRVRQVLNDHRKLEQAAGQEIWAARQAAPGGSDHTAEDISFCSGLSCAKNTTALEW